MQATGISSPLWRGRLVRLSAEDAETLAQAFTRWNSDSEFKRLLSSDANMLFSAKISKEWLEKELANPNAFWFGIRTLDDDRLIGSLSLDGINWAHGETWVGIGIGERAYWGRGYGSDAMRLAVDYAFRELNLQRVTLNVFDYNPRAIRSYEKVGFRVEGRAREMLLRDGRRYDIIHMGILRIDDS